MSLRQMLRALVCLVVCIVAMASISLAGGRTASAYGYDAPVAARVDVGVARGVEACPAPASGSLEGSTSPSVGVRGASPTSSRSFVATEAAAPRFVAASDGIIDTEAQALRQQIDDVADSLQTTGSPPPGVRQGGLPGKPGVYGNKSGTLPSQPEGYYTESDVWPGTGPRGTERIVVGANGEVWYTPDHYGNFRVVRT